MLNRKQKPGKQTKQNSINITFTKHNSKPFFKFINSLKKKKMTAC